MLSSDTETKPMEKNLFHFVCETLPGCKSCSCRLKKEKCAHLRRKHLGKRFILGLNRRAPIRFHSTVWTCLELAVYSVASLAYPFSHGFRALLLADEAVLRHSAVREAPPKHPPANGGNASVQPAKLFRRKQRRHASFASTDGTTLRNHAPHTGYRLEYVTCNRTNTGETPCACALHRQVLLKHRRHEPRAAASSLEHREPSLHVHHQGGTQDHPPRRNEIFSRMLYAPRGPRCIDFSKTRPLIRSSNHCCLMQMLPISF